LGKRSGAPENDEDAAKLSLKELDHWIRLAEFRAFEPGRSASLKKGSMKRLVWLEAQREKLHGVAAPKRKRF
jgi:hypothetical protein